MISLIDESSQKQEWKRYTDKASIRTNGHSILSCSDRTSTLVTRYSKVINNAPHRPSATSVAETLHCIRYCAEFSDNSFWVTRTNELGHWQALARTRGYLPHIRYPFSTSLQSRVFRGVPDSVQMGVHTNVESVTYRQQLNNSSTSQKRLWRELRGRGYPADMGSRESSEAWGGTGQLKSRSLLRT